MPRQGRNANKPGQYRMTKRAELDRSHAYADHRGGDRAAPECRPVADVDLVDRRGGGRDPPTAYRHFADMDEVFGACMGHRLATHPTPDPSPWVAIEGFEARARRVLTDLYRWYGDIGYVLYPIFRDIDSVPPRSRAAIEGMERPVRRGHPERRPLGRPSRQTTSGRRGAHRSATDLARTGPRRRT